MPFSSNYPANTLKNVQTFQQIAIAMIYGDSPVIHIANRKFDDLASFKAQLGNTVTFRRQPQLVVNKGTIAPLIQGVDQNFLTLAIDQQASLSYSFTQLEEYFNLGSNDWKSVVQNTGVMELGTHFEIEISKEFENAFRFYGSWDGQGNITPINSYLQLADIVSYVKEFGYSKVGGLYGILPETKYPPIMDSGLGKFAVDRNNEISKYEWAKGSVGGFNWLSAINTLPIHYAGYAGEAQEVLTVVSTNDPTGKNVTQITCTGSLGTRADAIKKGDAMRFADGVGSFDNLRYRAYVGHQPTVRNYVAMCAAADAASTAGTVTITLTHPLCWDTAEARCNLNHPIVAGMQISVAPSHQIGAIVTGNGLYFALPTAKSWFNSDPYKYAVYTDTELTGLSIGMWSGMMPDTVQQLQSIPVIYGKTIEPLNIVKILLPIE